jgi:hypothetical protein
METALVACALLLIAFLACAVESRSARVAAYRRESDADRVELSPAGKTLAALSALRVPALVVIDPSSERVLILAAPSRTQGPQVPFPSGRTQDAATVVRPAFWRGAAAPVGSGCLKPLACGKEGLDGPDGDSFRCSDASF